MGARENECQISQNYILHMTFSENCDYTGKIILPV